MGCDGPTDRLEVGQPSGGEALVWFRKSERPVALIDALSVKSDPEPAPRPALRDKSPAVGQVLRKA